MCVHACVRVHECWCTDPSEPQVRVGNWALPWRVPQYPCVYVRAGNGAGVENAPFLRLFISELGNNY